MSVCVDVQLIVRAKLASPVELCEMIVKEHMLSEAASRESIMRRFEGGADEVIIPPCLAFLHACYFCNIVLESHIARAWYGLCILT